MALFIQKREKSIVDDIKKHADTVAETVKNFVEALNLYLDGDKEKSQEQTKLVHKLEAQADDYRRKIDREMYEGAFMPSIRESLFVTVDAVDDVANEAETTGDILTLIQPSIPEEIVGDLREMGKLTVICAEKLRDGVYNLFNDINLVFDEMKEVEYYEGAVDKYVWGSLQKVFKELKIKKFSEKLLLRELILHINYISNKMEDASDKLDIIALKLKT